jgi:RNA polymerase sigma-54 factor
MQLMPSLNVRQKQSLVMTPQLQQAIKLLQMTNIDIKNFLEEQALDNPFMEVNASADSENNSENNADNAPATNQPEADALTTGAPADLAPADLTNDINERASLAEDPAANSDFDNRFGSEAIDYGNLGGSAGKAAGGSDDFDAIANLAENGPESLIQFVLRQIDLSIFDPRQRFIAYELATALEPSGWLGRPLEELSINCGCTMDEAEEVLTILQKLEPEGVFARDLSECLRIQAREQDELTPIMEVVLDNLTLLGKGEIAVLARRAKCETSDIAQCLRTIREFNPKPGEAYEMAPLFIGAPDVIVRNTSDGWIVDLNRSTLPSVVINEEYANQVAQSGRNKAQENAKEFATQGIGSAKWLQRALEQRNATTLKISAEIVRQQSDFLREGLVALKPLALKDVAEAVGMHESTVSRVTSGLMMATPNGSFPMKSLFSVSIASSDDGDSKAAAAVRKMIATIVSGEVAGKPLSDDAIADQVSQQGVKLARRTVAKYRDMLGIPSSSERRRQARLNMAG